MGRTDAEIPNRNRFVRVGSVGLTVVLLIALEWLRQAGIQSPDFPIILLLGVALSTYLGGRRLGFLNAVLACTYLLFVFYNDNIARFLLWTLLILGAPLLTDAIRRREQNTNEARYRSLLVEAARQTLEMRLLDRVRIALAHELELSIILRTVVEAVADIFGYTHISIYTLDGDVAVLRHQVGYDHVIERVPIGSGVSGRVMSTGQPILLEDVSVDPDFLGAVVGLVSEVCVPLFDEGRVVGVFNIESSLGVRLTQADLRIALALSELIGIAISRARLYTEVRASEARYRAVVEDQTEMICRGLPDGTLTFVNGAFCRYVQLPREQLLGRNFINALPETMRRTFQDKITALNLATPIADFDYTLRRTDGVSLSQHWTFRAIFGETEHITEIQAVGRDITEQKHAEAQVVELAIEREKVNMLQSFIQDTSHNLNTPISVLRTASYLSRKFADQMLQQTSALADLPTTPDRTRFKALQESAGHVQHQMVIQEHNTKKLQKIVTGLLRLAELDRNPGLTLRPRSVNMFAETALDAVQGVAAAKKITLTSILDLSAPRAPIDDWEFNQALQQLVENAIDFTPVGGTIIARTTHDDQVVTLAIEDTGIGIAEADLLHIFDRFYRVEASHNDAAGKVGLGLAIVQKIVEAHHGRIEVTSTPNKGSTFRVIVPRAQTSDLTEPK